MTAQPLPLATRPRRRVVPRPPTRAEAERALRRTVPRTTTSTWSASALPGTALARTGVPLSEALSSVFLVAVGVVPVLVWTGAAPAGRVTLAVALAVTAYLLRARRVVVGRDFVAIRSLLRCHVAGVDHVRHLQLRPTQRGGQLCLHAEDGRCLHLRRVEVDQPAVRDALRALADCGASTRDPLTCALLSLDTASSRTVTDYLPA